MLRPLRKLIYHEKYHDNCHDYLKPYFLNTYAVAKYRALLYDISKTIPKIDICQDTPDDLYAEVIVADQHGVIFSHAHDIYPVLATYALNACVGLIMYVPTHHVASLAHIDGLPGYSKKSAIEDGVKIDFDPVQENITTMLKYIRTLCSTSEKLYIDYYLIGGIFDLSEVMIHDIIECLNEYPNKKYQFTFKGRNILGPENQSRNICFNTKNGKITHFDYKTNYAFYSDYLENGLPINIIKAPRKSEALLDITYVAQINDK